MSFRAAYFVPDGQLQDHRLDTEIKIFEAAFAEMNACSLPLAEQIHREILSLPIGPHLFPLEQTSIVKYFNGFN